MKQTTFTASLVAGCLLAVLTGCNQNSDQSNNNSTTTNQPAPSGASLSTNGDVKVDNTKVNERDRGNTNLTALDQGNSDADVKISASIRKMVVSSTNDFSTMAKNIKIITQSGKVTLRGPVSTDGEKTQIESIAKQVAGDANVENDLEVKTN